MAKKINNKDFIEEGFGKPLLDFFKMLDDQIELSKKNLKDFAKELKKEVGKNPLKSGADVKELDKQKEQTETIKRLFREQEQARKELAKIAEREAKREAQIEANRRKEIARTAEFEKRERIKLANELIKQKKKEEAANKRFSDKLKREQEKQILRQKKLIEKNKAEEGSLKQLRQQLKLNVKAYDSLSKEERENTQVGKVLQKQIQKLQAELLKLEQATGRSQRNVGNYTSAWGKLGNLFRSGLGILGITGGITALSSAVRNGIEIIKGYSSANAELAGVLGKTRQETIELQAQQKALGATTQFSATEVAKAQIEFARLGQSEKDIQNLTPVVLSVATALKEELAPVSELIAGQLNAFGESSEKATEFGDKLARSTQISALNFQRLSVALPKVGTAADELGVSFDETLSILGSVVDKNIEAEKAGTAFRNILLESSKTGTDWRKNLEKIRNSTNKLGLATELFGKQNALVAVTIADNTEKIKENTKQIENAGGTAEKVAKEQLNTLEGDLQLLNSAWEALILSFTNGENTIRDLVQGLTSFVNILKDNLGLIKQVGRALVVAVKVWASYKAGVLLTAAAQALFNKETGLFTAKIPNLIRGLKSTNGGFKALFTTLKANPLGLLISAITTVISLMGFLSDETDEATEAQKKLNEEQKKFIANQESINKRFAARDKLSKQGLETLKNDIEELVKVQQEEADALISQNENLTENLKKREDLISQNQNIVASSKEEADALQRLNILGGRQTEIDSETIALNVKKIAKDKADIENKKTQIQQLNKLIALKSKNNEKEKEELGLLQEIDLKIKKERQKRDEAQTEQEIKNSQKIIKELEARKRALLELEKTKEKVSEKSNENDKKELENIQKANDLAAENLKKDLENTKKIEDEKLAYIEESNAKAFEAARSFLDKQNQLALDSIDNRVQQSAQQVDKLTTLAASGNKEAARSLTAEAQNQRKLEAERERTIKRQVAQAAILAGLELTIAASRRGDSAPAQTAATQLNTIGAAGTEFSNITNAVGFFTGTEKVSADLGEHKFYDGKDGYNINVHGTERILTGAQNAPLEGLSNEELSKAGVLYKKGAFDAHKYATDSLVVERKTASSNEELIKEVKELKKAYEKGNNKSDFKYDPIRKALRQDIKEKGKLTQRHYKKGRLL